MAVLPQTRKLNWDDLMAISQQLNDGIVTYGEPSSFMRWKCGHPECEPSYTHITIMCPLGAIRPILPFDRIESIKSKDKPLPPHISEALVERNN